MALIVFSRKEIVWKSGEILCSLTAYLYPKMDPK